MRRVLLAVPAAAAVLLTACGDPAGPGGTPETAPASTAPAPTAVPTSPKAVPPAGRRVVVEGVVEAGVEPGCQVITTPTGTYLVLGTVPVGVPVRITGVALTAVSTTCQQGTPLRVVRVQRR